MKRARRRALAARWVGQLALAGVSAALALGLAELALRAFPQWVPAEVRVNPPVRRVRAWVDETYEIRLSDGDLFYHLRGSLAPLPPEADRVVAQVHMTTDANGFRNASPEQASYQLVALGDSMTRASAVPTAWPQALAELGGLSVLNLGEVGAGPQQELAIFRRYGLPKRPQWVVLAFFEGNDLYDAGSYEQASPFILPRVGRHLLSQGLEALRNRGTAGDQAAANADNRSKVTLTLNDVDLELAFFPYYVSWLSTPREVLAPSRNFAAATQAIATMRLLSEAAGAQFLLVYVPTKAHIYLPHVPEADTLARVMTGVPTLEVNQAGYLQFSDQAATPALMRAHRGDQRDLVADFAAAEGIYFLDLTPAFETAAGAGAELYYPFDTHWNQAGHDLAAQTIALYLGGGQP